MVRPILVIIASVLCIVQESTSYHNGAPPSQCKTMIPEHYTDPQSTAKGPLPFKIVLDKTNIKPGESIHVTINSTIPNKTFYGFLALGQPHNNKNLYEETDKSFGKFKTDGNRNLKFVKCHGISESAVTHSNRNPKQSVEFDWIAPNENGEFVILVTFVQDYKTFWIRIPSEKIIVNNKDGPENVAAHVAAAIMVQNPSDNEISAVVKRSVAEFYDGCGSIKGCFGLPTDCVSTQNCQIFTTFRKQNERYLFQLAGQLTGTTGYIANALSFDNRMQNSSVVACVLEADSEPPVKTSAFYTAPTGYGAAKASDVGITLSSGQITNGHVLCEFTREAAYETGLDVNVSYDLDNTQFYLLLAMGTSGTISALQRHNLLRDAAPETTFLNATSIVGETDEDELKNPMYFGCGETKGCFGVPNGCVLSHNCEMMATFDENFTFQVTGLIPNGSTTGHVSMGLSFDDTMGQDSVIGCIWDAGTVAVRSYYNLPDGKNNAAMNDPNAGLNGTATVSAYLNGYVYCQFNRTGFLESEELQRNFSLSTEQYYILMARSSNVSEERLGPHLHSETDVTKSPRAVYLNETTIFDEDDEDIISQYYRGCGSIKGCFGMPSGCVTARSCQIFTTFQKQNGRYFFQLAGQLTGTTAGYIANALSFDNRMQHSSVVACVLETGNDSPVKTSAFYTAPTGYGAAKASDDGIMFSSGQITNGHVLCEFTREAAYETGLDENVLYDLDNTEFYLLLAMGTLGTSTSLQQHNVLHGPAPEATFLNATYIVGEDEEDALKTPMYVGCGETKSCFGVPNGCVASRTCEMMATFDANLTFQVTGRIPNGTATGHVSVGLSFDDTMGQDSVIGCIWDAGTGTVAVRSYYNLPGVKNNAAMDDPNAGLNGPASVSAYFEGFVYCQFNRTEFLESEELESNFTLTTDQYYILMARSSEASEERLGPHLFGPTDVARSARAVFLNETTAFNEDDETIEQLRERFYGGCEDNKGCFGLPNPQCVRDRNCELFTSFNGSRYFQVTARVTNPNGYSYVGVGLSFDDSMGQDLVTGCYFLDGVVGVGSFYNVPNGKRNSGFADLQNGIVSPSIRHEDGYIFCEFTRTSTFNEAELGRTFNLDSDEYHILLSRGPISSTNGLSEHPGINDKGASPDAVPLTYIGILGVKSNILIELHGSFMIMAWLLCASTGMFTARYYKQTHTNINPLNKAFWFMLHISCMITTVLLTICGIIFIFVELDGYSEGLEGSASWHPILGLILLGLAVCQVGIAFFRPHPGTKRRPLFNWVHWAIGNSAHIVGIACIFLAEQLSKTGLNGQKRYIYVLVGFVVFHAIMHVIMSIHTFLTDKEMDVHNKKRATRPGPMKPSGKSEEANGTGFRTAMLALYAATAAAVSITLVIFVTDN